MRSGNCRYLPLLLAVATAACGGATYGSGPCISKEGQVFYLHPWYGMRVTSIAGQGTSCEAPVKIVGAYQRCSDRRCIPDYVEQGYRVPFPFMLAQQHWIQMNFYNFRFLGVRTVGCGQFTGHAFRIQTKGKEPADVIFDMRGFRESQTPLENL
jgi:hypothetical protein